VPLQHTTLPENCLAVSRRDTPSRGRAVAFEPAAPAETRWVPEKKRWPSWPPPATVGYTRDAEGVVDDERNLRFTVPAGAYATVPAWRSRRHYLAALRWHPRLAAVCRRHEIAVETFLAVMALYAARADDETGRNIAVANDVLGQLSGISGRHVRNATRAARNLGVLHVVLAGTTMTLAHRAQVLDQYRRGHPSRRWRHLPNFAAATVPAELVTALHRPLHELRSSLAAAEHAARAAAVWWQRSGLLHTHAAAQGRRPPRDLVAAALTDVENHASTATRRAAFFHLPEGEHLGASEASAHPKYLPLFQPGCGQTPAQRAEQRRTAASRPTNKHRQGEVRRVRGLDPALRDYVRALTARLPHRRGQPDLWSRVQPRRLAQSLHRHWRAGLTPDELTAGMSTFLRARGRSWTLDWQPDQHVDQARYLAALLRDADRAGWIQPDPQPVPAPPG
jgi:hypothetical protein